MSGVMFSTIVETLTTHDSEGTHARKRIGQITALDAFAGRRVSDNLEALIVECNTSALDRIKEWPRSKGFEVMPIPLSGGHTGKTRLVLQLIEDRFRDVFWALGDILCDEFAGLPHEESAVRCFHDQLVRWQSFLQKHGPDGLSDEARCGLYGELVVLHALLESNIAAEAVVPAWRGCKKASQDFQFLNLAIEVKTTRATVPDRIIVSNVQQLDEHGIDHMFLTLLHMNENEASGETLPQRVDDLRYALPDNQLDEFNAGLEEVGYSDTQRRLYARTRYRLIDQVYFEIKDDFPRITRQQIPEGVKAIRYELNFDACLPYRCESKYVFDLLGDVGNHGYGQ